MTYDKTCGNVRLKLSEDMLPWCEIIDRDSASLRHLTLEDLRDLRYLIDRALEAGE